MRIKLDSEVIIVGAGPAGASTAYHLAKRNRRVLLLEKQTFPRDKSCGDGLTRAATKILAEMGILNQLKQYKKIRGVRVFMRGKRSRDFEYPKDLTEPNYGLVIPRKNLDYVICQKAVSAGAKLLENTFVNKLIIANNIIIGVELTQNGQKKQLYAPVVVAGDGASSRLARQAGLVKNYPEILGFGIRGYYTNLVGLTDLLEIYLPLMDSSNRYILPSYGWVFPIDSKIANIGVAIFQRVHQVNLRELFKQFLEILHKEDQRFKHSRLLGSWKGASLRFDFTPEQCTAPGLLLVGDAAGMISPFTGEGISYALESAKLAAEVIDRNLKPNMTSTPNLSDYSILLDNQYSSYFETGRRSLRRYLLIWHVLESTFDSEQPLFAYIRKILLFPEGVRNIYASKLFDDVSPLIASFTLNVREDLLAIGEILIDTIRQDWPSLARLSTSTQGDPGIPFRPALFLLLASYFGDSKNQYLIPIGAAIELGYLAAVAHWSLEEKNQVTQSDSENQSANWGNMLALILGDFLLSKAYELSSRAGAKIGNIITNSLVQICKGNIRELHNEYNLEISESEYLKILSLKFATLFELPCHLGAELSGTSPKYFDALTNFGKYIGLAFQLTEEVFKFSNKSGKFDSRLIANLTEGKLSLPIIKALKTNNNSGKKIRNLIDRNEMINVDFKTISRLVTGSGALDETLKLAQLYMRKAQIALKKLPDNPARTSLFRLAEYVVTREVPKKLHNL